MYARHMESQQPNHGKKILDEVRDEMRLHHYSIHTERSYCDWIRRFALYHHMKSRDDLANGEQKIEAFLTHLAVEGKVAPATQNQAMNALVFLYKREHGACPEWLQVTLAAVEADRPPAPEYGRFPWRAAGLRRRLTEI